MSNFFYSARVHEQVVQKLRATAHYLHTHAINKRMQRSSCGLHALHEQFHEVLHCGASYVLMVAVVCTCVSV
jgi:hypothetical protein